MCNKIKLCLFTKTQPNIFDNSDYGLNAATLITLCCLFHGVNILHT